MKRFGLRLLRGFGRGLRNGFVAIGALAFLGGAIALADYTVTQGTGLTFASIVISAKHYAALVVCDATVGETQCQAVNSSGQASVIEANSPAILAAVQSSIPAGTAIIGKTGIDQTTDGTTNGVRQTTQYPAGAVAETASAAGTTAATTATLATNTGQTTYICWYSIRANATAAVDVTDTITGTITGTLSSLLWVAPVASGLGVDEMIFNPCVPASGTNQAIAVVSGAPSTGGNVTVKAGGYLK